MAEISNAVIYSGRRNGLKPCYRRQSFRNPDLFTQIGSHQVDFATQMGRAFSDGLGGFASVEVFSVWNNVFMGARAFATVKDGVTGNSAFIISQLNITLNTMGFNSPLYYTPNKVYPYSVGGIFKFDATALVNSYIGLTLEGGNPNTFPNVAAGYWARVQLSGAGPRVFVFDQTNTLTLSILVNVGTGTGAAATLALQSDFTFVVRVDGTGAGRRMRVYVNEVQHGADIPMPIDNGFGQRNHGFCVNDAQFIIDSTQTVHVQEWWNTGWDGQPTYNPP